MLWAGGASGRAGDLWVVTVNSSLQVALALTPVLLFVSLILTTHLTLVFPTLLALVLGLATRRVQRRTARWLR